MISSDRHADARTRRAPPARWVARWALAVFAAVAAVVVLLVPSPASQALRDADRARLAWAALHEPSAATAGAVPADRVHAARAAAPRPIAVSAVLAASPEGACRARPAPSFPASPFESPKAAGDLPEPEPPRAAGATDPQPLRRAVVASSDACPRQAGLAPPLRPPRA
jgi:hypothetical protein